MTTPATRSDSTELPSSDEVMEILQKESSRMAVRFDFLQQNDALFDAHRELAKQAGVDDTWITNYQKLSLKELETATMSAHQAISRYISQNPEYTELYERVFNSLIPQESTAQTEAIFVFGAKTNARIERAVELYKESVAPHIIISGDSPHYIDEDHAEANRMAVYAVEQGVPVEALTLEESSITLPDNVKRTIDVLEERNWRPASLTIIASNIVLTRATFEWYKFCPWDVEVHAVAARPQSATFTSEGWYRHSDGIALVLNEYAKLVLESRIDIFRRDGGTV